MSTRPSGRPLSPGADHIERLRSAAERPESATKIEQALFANDTFYLAFAQKDHEVMANLWSAEQPVVCIHPGWPALTDRTDIVESWRNILGNPDQPGIDFYNASARNVGDLVFVTCYEQLSGSVCVATNGFVNEHGRMLMFHHHAGQCANPPQPDGVSVTGK